MVMRVSEGEASFNSEEQNEPINPDDCLFMEEWFDYYNEAEVNFGDPAFDFFGFIDPSLGKDVYKRQELLPGEGNPPCAPIPRL